MFADTGRWDCTFLHDGIELRPVQAAGAGVIRVRERYRPLRTIADIVDEEIDILGQNVTDIAKDGVEYLLTADGEYAAIAGIRGKVGDKKLPYLAIIGVTYADDWYRRVDARCHVEEHFPLFRAETQDLVFRSTLGLSDRRRRFYYTPPKNWQGLGRGLLTEWYPPDYPFADAVITVPPAWTRKDLSPPLLDRMVIDGNMRTFFRESRTTNNFLSTEHGLSGESIQVTGQFPGKPRRIIDQIFLRDDRYTYYLRLNCREDLHAEHKRIFDAVVKSARPNPTEIRNTQTDALTHWID
jgi:hypothetical protein